ncbi:MAG: (d)CMP kinase [Candidatus Eremiobacteraeota bacterium]|nr:(d)CMP kinase [Candidatus Eremiobacteraeota bacterium]
MKRKPAEALQIAIDGPVASGKSTVAKRLAARLGFLFLDTGALYRAVAYIVLQTGQNDMHEADVVARIQSDAPQVVIDPADPLNYRIRVGDQLLREQLFSAPVAGVVSRVAAMPGVRRQLLAAQRAFADERAIVMAGRDIGTVVLPQARHKFFLTASLATRVERRLRQLHARGIEITREALTQEIEQRDRRDSTRQVSPLVRAQDAIELDTSRMSVDDVVDELQRLVGGQGGP